MTPEEDYEQSVALMKKIKDDSIKARREEIKKNQTKLWYLLNREQKIKDQTIYNVENKDRIKNYRKEYYARTKK